MNSAISLDTAGVKWPFAPQPQPQPPVRGSRPSSPRSGHGGLSGFPVPASAPTVTPQPIPTVPDLIEIPVPVPVSATSAALAAGAAVTIPAPLDRVVPSVVALPVPASMGISGVYSDNLARAKPVRRARVSEIGSGMFVHQAQTVGAMRRQMVGDVALVAAWAVMIPAVLWLGHAAGF